MQPEALSRWTPAVSTRCSRLAPRATLSSSQSESNGRQVVASPREMRRLSEPVRDVPPLLPRAYLCSDDCRKPARASQLRVIRATYQASPGAREDHRDRNRELRKRAPEFHPVWS
jgi:hypothetical protein